VFKLIPARGRYLCTHSALNAIWLTAFPQSQDDVASESRDTV